MSCLSASMMLKKFDCVENQGLIDSSLLPFSSPAMSRTSSNTSFASTDDFCLFLDNVSADMMDACVSPNMPMFPCAEPVMPVQLVASSMTLSPVLSSPTSSSTTSPMTPALTSSSFHSGIDVFYSPLDETQVMFPDLNALDSTSCFANSLMSTVPGQTPHDVTPLSESLLDLASVLQTENQTIDASALSPTGDVGSTLTHSSAQSALPIRKSKAGRKPKARSSDPVVVEAERAAKRAKNTEAARRSRLRRIERIGNMETHLVELEKEVEVLRVKDVEWSSEKKSLQDRISLLERALKQSGIPVPV